jgi:hypothetical protein
MLRNIRLAIGTNDARGPFLFVMARFPGGILLDSILMYDINPLVEGVPVSFCLSGMVLPSGGKVLIKTDHEAQQRENNCEAVHCHSPLERYSA